MRHALSRALSWVADRAEAWLYKAERCLTACRARLLAPLTPVYWLRVEVPRRGWLDRDQLLFHAAFQVLVDFIEQERPFGPGSVAEQRAWVERLATEPGAEHHREAYLELLDLYEWYKGKGYLLDLDAAYMAAYAAPLADRAARLAEVSHLEQAHEAYCDAALRRLVELRSHLWT